MPWHVSDMPQTRSRRSSRRSSRSSSKRRARWIPRSWANSRGWEIFPLTGLGRYKEAKRAKKPKSTPSEAFNPSFRGQLVSLPSPDGAPWAEATCQASIAQPR